MAEIVKIQCDICGTTWDPQEEVASAVLNIFRPGMAVNPETKQLEKTMGTEKTWICHDCILKYFNIAGIKQDFQTKKREKKEKETKDKDKEDNK